MKATNWFVKCNSFRFISIVVCWFHVLFESQFLSLNLNYTTSQGEGSLKIFEPQVSAIMGAYAQRIVKVIAMLCS